jgi:hypothetical protein
MPEVPADFIEALAGFEEGRFVSMEMALTEMPPVQSVLETLRAIASSPSGKNVDALLKLRASDELQKRIDELADRCTEGQLTTEERKEYEALIDLGDFISVLQAKVRRVRRRLGEE